MSVRPRGRKWMVDVVFPSGRRFRQAYDTIAEANLIEAQVRASLAEGVEPAMPTKAVAVVQSKMDLDALVKEMETVYSAEWKWTPRWHNTAIGYAKQAVEHLKTLGITRIETIDVTTITLLEKFWRERGNAGATMNRKVTVLRSLWYIASKHGLVKNDEFPEVEHKEEDGARTRVFTPEEQAAIIAKLVELRHPITAHLVEWMFETGLRAGAALATELGWVTNEFSDTITYPAEVMKGKAGKRRPQLVLKTERMKQIIRERREAMDTRTQMPRAWTPDDPRLFPIEYTTFRQDWNEARDALGGKDDAEWVPHSIRHTFCSRLANAGLDPYAIKALAGHTVLATTERYTHLVDQKGVDALRKMRKVG